jgi:hypothetical protein
MKSGFSVRTAQGSWFDISQEKKTMNYSTRNKKNAIGLA